MSGPLRLVVFDVDGTLVDSRVQILETMRQACTDLGIDPPDDATVLHGVGLSLPELMQQMLPDASPETQAAIVARYRTHFMARHSVEGTDSEAPFFPGMRALLDRLRDNDFTLLATATGKSRRGLDRLIARHGLDGYFQSTQVADDHPSKPHPSMLLTALRDTGVEARNAVMIGDTSYDMAMGRSAGLSTIGVSWGYHGPDLLRDADVLVDSADQLTERLTLWMESLT